MYKVLWEGNDERLYSFTLGPNHPKTIVYKENQITYPHPKTKLFIFDSLWSVQEFVGDSSESQCVVYKALAVNPTLAPQYVLNFRASLQTMFWEMYWKDKLRLNFLLISKTPKGSMVCDSIKLVERINL